MKEIEERYRFIAENVKDVIWTMDLNLNFTFISPSIEDLRGYNAEEMLNQSLQEIMTSNSYRSISDIIKKEISPKKLRDKNHNPVVSTEIDLYHKDGSIIPVEVKMNLVRDRSGNAEQILGIARDISERKKIEGKLKESEEKYRILSEVAIDFIMIHDMNGKITYANKSVFEMGGYKEDDIINVNFSKIVTPDTLKEALERRKKRLNGDFSMSHYEATFKGKNRNYIPVDVVSIPIVRDKVMVGIHLIARDISQRKNAENKLRKSEVKFKNAFNRANFYKDLFAHDISNILQSINTGLELSELYLNLPEKRDLLTENFRIIKEQLQRGSTLVNNVRKISDIEESVPDLKDINLCDVLRRVIKHVDQSYKEIEKNINVETEISEIVVKADDFLEDVFENLLINAIKHNNSELIEINIKIRKEIGQSNIVRLEFEDNGKGIEDGSKEDVFNRSSFKKGSVHGMGLGLSLVKKIINSYKGKIWVENRIVSDYSKGCKFIILIPI